MAKAQKFGDKVKGKVRTHKKMVRYILPLKHKKNAMRFKEGMLAVPEEKNHSDYITEHLDELSK